MTSVRGRPTRRQWIFAIAMVVVPTVLLLATPALLRHLAMGDPQREALALMDVAPAPLPGEIAFLWLATANNIVPEAERQLAIDEDSVDYRRYLDEMGARLARDGGDIVMYVPMRRSRFPTRRPMNLGSEACQLGVAGSRCLAAVRDNPAATRYLLDVETDRLETARRMLASGHVADTYPAYSPFIAWEPLALELTASALEAAEGRVPAAMQRTCGLLAWARTQSALTTTLALRTEAWSTREAASRLLLDLRLAYPDVPLPADCVDAVAPTSAAEFDVCPIVRAEFRKQLALMPRMPAGPSPIHRVIFGVTGHFFSHDPLGRAWLAQRHAPFCSEAGREALASGAADAPEPGPLPEPLACIAAVQQCHALGPGWLGRSVLTSSWLQVTNAHASQRLLDAAHAQVGQGGTGPLPDIPGHEVRHASDGQGWVLVLRHPQDNTSETVLRLVPEAR